MDAATAAAVAALVVSILAMTIAFAQAIQQYFITGQLIRICDSVVYGKMPGQGQRVWEHSQFRFRVVYSIPQICLRPDLWADGALYHSDFKQQRPLPDLRHCDTRADELDRGTPGASQGLAKRSAYAAVPGEAGWVSFCRATQHATGTDLLYEMVDGDADRCPGDLPVVPMQVSMRDIVTVALMTGMTCTDASFERKSLAMEGLAGTITSSWHPILGALIRFAPKNSDRPHGLRIGHGSVNPDWMARMWDVVVVAGRHYSTRERKYYEAYDCDRWVTVSQGRTLTKYVGPQSNTRRSSPSASLRRRTHGMASNRSGFRASNASRRESVTRVHVGAPLESELGSEDGEMMILRSPLDGDWSFVDEEKEPSAASDPETKLKLARTSTQRSPARSDRPWYRRWRFIPGDKGDSTPPSGAKLPLHHVFDVEKNDAKAESKPSGLDAAATAHPPAGSTVNRDLLPSPSMEQSYPSSRTEMNFAYRALGRDLLDGPALQKYIAEKQKAKPVSPTGQRQLLLPSFPSEGEVDTHVQDEEHDDWRRLYAKINQDRVTSYATHWRNIVQRRQKKRNKIELQGEWETTSLHSSPPPSIGPGERTRRLSSTRTRSSSKNSTKGQSGDFRSSSHDKEQPRGRVQERTLREAENYEQSPDQIESDLAETESPHLPLRSHAQEGSAVVDNEDNTVRRKSKARRLVSPPPRKEDTEVIWPVGGYQSQDADVESEVDQDQVTKQRRVEIVKSPPPNVTWLGPLKGILKPPRQAFSEDPRPVREGVAPLRDAGREGIPPGARWTKINRKLVNPKALEIGNERFEEIDDYVVVLRVLSREEIEAYADKTQEIREKRSYEDLRKESNDDVTKGTESPDSKDSGRISSTNSPQRDQRSPSPVDLPPEPDKGEDSAINKGAAISGDGSTDSPCPPEREDNINAEPEVPANESQTEGSGLGTLISTRQPVSSPVGSGSAGSDDRHGTKAVHFAEDPASDEHPDEYRANQEGGARSSRPAELWRPEIGHKKQEPRFRSAERRQLRQSPPPSSDLPPQGERHHPSRSLSPRASTARRHSTSPRSSPFRPRRGSTHSTISISRTPEDDNEPWSGFSYEEPHVKIQEPLAIEAGDVSAPNDVDSTEGASTAVESTSPIDGTVDWLWICQADVIPGYFATPWQSHFDASICSGAIAVISTALEWFTDAASLVYVDVLPHCEEWVYAGRCTHPSYAINAMGGIIVGGKYSRVKFPSFATPIPPLQLLRDPFDPPSLERNHHPFAHARRPGPTNPHVGTPERQLVRRLAELMSIDTWLAFSGRQPEIYNGRSDLMHSAPALVQKLMRDFAYEFAHVDRTAAEGGWQLLHELADLVVRQLLGNQLGLDEAEQLFACVSVLRAAKMALGIVLGSDTALLKEVLMRDVQVYFI